MRWLRRKFWDAVFMAPLGFLSYERQVRISRYALLRSEATFDQAGE